MSILPNTKSALLDFCAAHSKTWGGLPTQIGLTAGEVDVLDAAVSAASQTAENVIETRDAAKAATLADDQASQNMRAIAGALIAKIKATAEITGNSNIYVLAQIPAPAAPGPAPAPQQPIDVKPFLEPGGGLTIKWKTGPNEGAVTYNVYRKLPSQATFSQIGTASGRTKKFSDTNLPFGASGVQYFVQGWRGATGGTPSEMLTVYFGTVGGDGEGSLGFGYSLSNSTEAAKIAA